MNSSTVRGPSLPIQRATLQGYLLILLGLLFVVENAVSVLAASGSLTGISGVVLGFFAIGTGVLVSVRPENVSRGTEPAPTYLYVLAGVATIAFLFSIVFVLQG
jgi:surface polysaccharide O-acyltransferase-like enzyme